MLKRPRKRNRKATYGNIRIWLIWLIWLTCITWHFDTFWLSRHHQVQKRRPVSNGCGLQTQSLSFLQRGAANANAGRTSRPARWRACPDGAPSLWHTAYTLYGYDCSLKRLEELRTIDMQSYCRQMPSSWKDQQLQEQQLQLQQQVRDGQGHPNLKYQPVQKALLRLNPCVLKIVRPHNFLLWTRVLHSFILSWPVSNPIQSLRQWIRIMSTVSWKFVSNIYMWRINGWSKMTSSSTSISNSSNNRNADSDWACQASHFQANK